eukprot:9291700-Ditylum_brightwellii.AAC.1
MYSPGERVVVEGGYTVFFVSYGRLEKTIFASVFLMIFHAISRGLLSVVSSTEIGPSIWGGLQRER